MGGKFEPWVIAPNVLSESGYVRHHLLNKERFHLLKCPEDLWMQMNEEQLGSMWRYLSETPPARILQVILEAVLHTGPNQAIGSGDQDIRVEKGRKIRVKDLLELGSIKGRRLEEELKIDAQKRDDSRFPIEMWDRRAWDYKGDKESGALNVLWDSMLRWWR